MRKIFETTGGAKFSAPNPVNAFTFAGINQSLRALVREKRKLASDSELAGMSVESIMAWCATEYTKDFFIAVLTGLLREDSGTPVLQSMQEDEGTFVQDAMDFFNGSAGGKTPSALGKTNGSKSTRAPRKQGH